MIARQQFLDGRDDRRAFVDLGHINDLYQRIPLNIQLGGRNYRINRSGDTIRVYDSTCPHWGGPVQEIADEKMGHIGRCPWHGYQFNLDTGASIDNRPCKLKPPARLVIDAQGACSLYRPD